MRILDNCNSSSIIRNRMSLIISLIQMAMVLYLLPSRLENMPLSFSLDKFEKACILNIQNLNPYIFTLKAIPRERGGGEKRAQRGGWSREWEKEEGRRRCSPHMKHSENPGDGKRAKMQQENRVMFSPPHTRIAQAYKQEGGPIGGVSMTTYQDSTREVYSSR